MPDDILRTKLFPPPARPNQVRRKTLLDKLILARQRGAQCVLVSAPAGFGKTTLVVDYARSGGIAFAWLGLDEGDNDLLRFWRYLDAALAGIDTRIGAGLRPALYASQEPAIEQIITGLINDITGLDQVFILVLDDYHTIQLPAIHDSLNFLLDHLPPQLQIVVTTRSDPPLNLARRRGRGQMIELRASDLRFTPDETAAFLNQSLQLGLTEADIASLSQRTEGWIAGLQMAALSMQDEIEPHRFVTAFSGDDHHIADYLVEEVLQRQLVEVQNFLLQTSILERMNASLCNAVTGRQDSVAMLNTLERANLFLLPLDNRREWFRYHHLFAELLHQRLRENCSAVEIARLHRNAVNWYETQGQVAQAVSHARAAEDWPEVLRLLEQNSGRLFASGELPQLADLANLLPVRLRKDSPALCMIVAWATLATNRYFDVPAWLDSIEAHFGQSAESILSDGDVGLDLKTRAALLEVLVVRLQLPATRPPQMQLEHILAIRKIAGSFPPGQFCLLNSAQNLIPVITFNLGQYAETTGDLELAARNLSECMLSSRETRNSSLFFLSAAHLANVQIAGGQLRAARQTSLQALSEPLFTGSPGSPFTALPQACSGAVEFELGRLDSARQYFENALATARLWNLWEALIPATFGQAWLNQIKGDTRAALAALNQLDRFSIPAQEMPLRAYTAFLEGPEASRTWLSTHPDLPRLDPEPGNEFLLLTTARLLAVSGRAAESGEILQRLIRYAQEGGRRHLQIQALVVLAVSTRQAQPMLQALSLAEPEGYISTFLLEGEPAADLLQLVTRLPDTDPVLQAYARKIIAAFEKPVSQPQKPSGQLVEPLSERELEVLRYIAQGLSNPEIASRLYLSANTLKAHTQNIFTKLDVHNRMQAVSKARELGLIE